MERNYQVIKNELKQTSCDMIKNESDAYDDLKNITGILSAIPQKENQL